MEKLYDALKQMEGAFEALPELDAGKLSGGRTVLIVVDMNNGFAKEGHLASERVRALIPSVVRLCARCGKTGADLVFFTDCHEPDSPEFASYPPHCLRGTREAELVDELKAFEGARVIRKNSTNGFIEEEFMRYLEEHPQKDCFILAGDCTDICILQFALSLKAHFNRLNRPSRVIVPVNAVDTFEAPGHDARLCGMAALHNMRLNGVEIVSRVV